MTYIKVKQIAGEERESDSLLRWAHRRTIHQNKNCIVPVVGNPGSGKSYWCLRFLEKNAEILGRKPDVTCCTRSAIEFMGKLNSGDLKGGDVLILEEVGVNISSREWQSKINKLINYVLQTFRNKNLTVLLNLPDVKMLDINVLRLIHGIVVMKGIDFENKKSKISFKVRQHNFEIHKDYWKHLRVNKDGKQVRIKRHTFKKPSKEILEEYEQRRLEFTEALNKRVMTELQVTSDKAEQKASGGNGREFTERQYDVQDLWHKGMTIQKDIAKELGCTASMVCESIKSMDKKWPMWRKSLRKRDISAN